MTKEFYIPLTRIRADRFLFLLVSLSILFLLYPFLESLMGLRLLVDAYVTFIVIAGVYAIREKKSVFNVALVLAILALAGSWSIYFMKSPAFQLLGRVSGALFFAFTAITLFSFLSKAKDIASDIIICAICTYFLIGLMWAYVYAILEIVQPGTFNGLQDGSFDTQSFIYFSFVTLTTLGYGDITPFTSQARFLSLLEAVFGQIYLAVVIARLVGIHITQSMEGNK